MKQSFNVELFFVLWMDLFFTCVFVDKSHDIAILSVPYNVDFTVTVSPHFLWRKVLLSSIRRGTEKMDLFDLLFLLFVVLRGESDRAVVVLFVVLWGESELVVVGLFTVLWGDIVLFMTGFFGVFFMAVLFLHAVRKIFLKRIKGYLNFILFLI